MADEGEGKIAQEERDGVPVFWSETEGPVTAGATFRIGTSDEI